MAAWAEGDSVEPKRTLSGDCCARRALLIATSKRRFAASSAAYNFYISDFAEEGGGFTASDFDALVSRRSVEVIDDDEQPLVKASAENKQQTVATGAVLSDVLEPELRVAFCGTAVGSRSARVGAYYAGRGNQFWDVLARVGLTPRRLAPKEFVDLPKYGIGLTDLAKFASGADSELSPTALEARSFRRKMEHFAPRAIAFNGKRAAETFFGRGVNYGRQVESINETAIFVLPSTSGAARRFWDESHWRELASFVLP